MVARSGVTLYRVVTVKRGTDRTFVAVDGGMGDNLEVSLYGSGSRRPSSTASAAASRTTSSGATASRATGSSTGVRLDAPRSATWSRCR